MTGEEEGYAASHSHNPPGPKDTRAPHSCPKQTHRPDGAPQHNAGEDVEGIPLRDAHREDDPTQEVHALAVPGAAIKVGVRGENAVQLSLARPALTNKERAHVHARACTHTTLGGIGIGADAMKRGEEGPPPLHTHAHRTALTNRHTHKSHPPDCL